MEDKLYTRVLHYLTIRARSEKEIRDYLKKILQKPSVAKLIREDHGIFIEGIITRLKSQKFLDDKSFAQLWIRSRLTFHPKGRRLITLELQQKGVSKEIIDEAFSQQEQAPSDQENATDILQRQRKKYERLPKQERFQKAGSMLARRGFDMDTIIQTIDVVFGK